MGSADWTQRRDRFRRLHESGLFVMPNPWDLGSARILASMGFPALATTSLGHAAALGKQDQTVTRDELIAHVAAISAAVGWLSKVSSCSWAFWISLSDDCNSLVVAGAVAS